MGNLVDKTEGPGKPKIEGIPSGMMFAPDCMRRLAPDDVEVVPSGGDYLESKKKISGIIYQQGAPSGGRTTPDDMGAHPGRSRRSPVRDESNRTDSNLQKSYLFA